MSLAIKWRGLAWYRKVLMVVFAIGLMGSLSSLLAQYVMGLNPCVMCIQQRVAMVVMTLMAGISLLLPVAKSWARGLAVMLASIPAVFGGYIAAKQLYIQSLPITEQPSCGAPWTFRLRGAPLFDLYEPIIRGTGVCGEVYKILGVALPMWSLLFFALMLMVLWGGLLLNKRFSFS